MQTCTVKIDKDKQGELVLIIQPSLLARILGTPITIWPDTYKEYAGKTVELKEVGPNK